jgi:Adenylate kinase and related kinases
MILIFGLAGSGKSLQAQILAARNDWRWLSAGQLLRDTKDPEITRIQHTGALVDASIVNSLIEKFIKKSEGEVEKIILEGYPRELSQATWLVENNYPIDIAIVLNVPHNELIKRLKIRGRADDAEQDAIRERFDIFERSTRPVLDLFAERGVKVVNVDGTGTVGEVHDRIMQEIDACKLV